MNTTAAVTVLLVAVLTTATALAAPTSDRAERFRQKMEERLQAMDTDGDGAISRQEYLQQAAERFARLDLNGDGLITVEEREQIRAQLLERRTEQFP